MDLSDYFYLAAGLGFLLASFLNLRQYKKNPIKYKNGRLAAILLFIAGVCFISSAALAYFYGV
jgi:drug/metabolite transporter (DMT)-like permease